MIRSTIVVTNETFASTQAGSVSSTRRGEVADDARDHGAVVGHVVVGDERDGAGTGCAPGEQARDELARGRRDDATSRIRLQRSDVRPHVLGVQVESTRRVSAVAGLRDRERDDGHGRVGEVAAQGVEVVGGVHGAEAGDHLGPRTIRPTDEQRVEAVLARQALGGGRRAPGEGGDSPLGGVARVLGVPGGVRAEEVAEAEVHDAHRRGRASVGRPAEAAQFPPSRGRAGPGASSAAYDSLSVVTA